MDKYDARELLIDELQAAVSGTGITTSITMDAPQEPADFGTETVRITYDRRTRRLPYNEASAAPERIQRDQNGDVTSEDYASYYESQFPVTIHGLEPDEQQRGVIIGAVEQRMDRYRHGAWDERDLNGDCISIYTTDMDARDRTDTEPPIRRDAILVHIEFGRYTSYTDDTMQTIDRSVTQN